MFVKSSTVEKLYPERASYLPMLKRTEYIVVSTVAKCQGTCELFQRQIRAGGKCGLQSRHYFFLEGALCPSFQEAYQGSNMQAGSATDNDVKTSTLCLLVPSRQEI